MDKDLHANRKSYEKGVLLDKGLPENPFELFEHWYSIAEESEAVDEANAMTLSTADAFGIPRGRIVLLKEVTNEGFVFYTNYKSEKGQAIAVNNNVCISFFWAGVERQVIINGSARKLSEEKSNTYFSQRPFESQLGALVSNQSEPIASRELLREKLASLEEKYSGKKVPKPENWGGYIIQPESFEFWQGRPSRLHDRIKYTRNKGQWHKVRLQP